MKSLPVFEGTPQKPARRLPEWLKIRLPNSPNYAKVKELVEQHQLHTVCEEARCPNLGGMLESGHRDIHDSW